MTNTTTATYVNPDYVIRRMTGNYNAAIARRDYAHADYCYTVIRAAQAQIAATR